MANTISRQVSKTRAVTFLMPFLMALSLAGCKRAENTAVEQKLNVVLIVVDTLGAKHLGCYGSGIQSSPRIDKLAAEGARYANAYATSAWTKPSIASIFSSRMPVRHGVIGPAKKLRSELETMAEVLQGSGYQSTGVVSHTFLGPKSGFQQGFDDYFQLNNTGKVHTLLTSELVSNQGIAALKKQAGAEKKGNFFLFLHYFDPHYRYRNHPKFNFTGTYRGPLKPTMTLEALERAKDQMTAEDVDYLNNLYREEVAYTDEQIGRVVDFLDESGLRKNTLIILTSDHGEGFLEHNYLGHTNTLYEELVHVPLVFNLPGVVTPGVHQELVSGIDILPTVAALTGQRRRDEWEGISFAAQLQGRGEPNAERPIMMELIYSKGRSMDPHIIALRTPDLKGIYDFGRDRWSLFDIAEDPLEQRNLAKTHASELEQIKGLMSDFTRLHAELRGGRQTESEDEIEISTKEAESLKSLGYL